ncbi:DUF6807 domain-containing protein [Cellulomonas bogoriensis]|uniref:Oxidoreductase n=1 Tax=Cellulomonas bogoriensis 69B4 = DSM 16987 TaxID=1386082 RepID=A0A0A0BNC4_9CELL|nr:PmoA family protein [Cellulomonas bogoriensis]KGM08569.1 hypothetical protein N869_07610 [Cellulomonas bogoriensis 69B4 = DSM 16987]
MSLRCTDDGTALTVTTTGEPPTGVPVELFRYVYRPDDAPVESPRPYLHPVRTTAGEVVTLFRPHDHVWHKGIAWSLPVVGPHSFWGGPTFVRERGYVQLDNTGSMDHAGFDRVEDGDRVAVAQRLVWHTLDGAPVVAEGRGLGVTVLDRNTWVLTFTTTMTNTSTDALDLGSPTTQGRENAGYGGLFWRGPRDFTGGTVLVPGERTDGEGVRGRRSPWLGFTGLHDGSGRESTLLVVDDPWRPETRDAGPRWFVRSEPFATVCPAPFFSEKVPFGPGRTLRFRYAVLVHDGAPDLRAAAELAARAATVPPVDVGDGG